MATDVLPRRFNSSQSSAVEVATADMVAGERIVRVSDRGAPQYGTATAPLYPVAIADTAALPGVPTGTFPPAGFTYYNFQAYASVAVYWKNGTATHTSVTLTAWAYTSAGDWVIVDTQTGVAPSTEIVLTGVGYRLMYVQVSSPAGGATGSINLYLAGV